MTHPTTTPWVPRSPYEMVGGYLWLGRLLDKLRATRSGGGGGYHSLETSSMDRTFLRELGLKADQLSKWVEEGLDDEAIGAKIADVTGQDPDARWAWSATMRRRFAALYDAMDAEEGRGPLKPADVVAGGVRQVVSTAKRATPMRIAAGALAGMALGGVLASLMARSRNAKRLPGGQD